MSNQRSDRVAQAIKRVVSEMLMRRVKDARISGMVSVTDVTVSGDLRHAKVFVSVFGEKAVQEQTMIGLGSAKGIIRAEVGHQLGLRVTPEITFQLDRSAERAAHINELIKQIHCEAEQDEPLGNATESHADETAAKFGAEMPLPKKARPA